MQPAPSHPDPPRPFDFLVDGELLRLSLLKHLQSKQISTVRHSARAGGRARTAWRVLPHVLGTACSQQTAAALGYMHMSPRHASQ